MTPAPRQRVDVPDIDREFGIVRHRRWLAWGWRHGLRVRPFWLAEALVVAWNRVSCRVGGHEWIPEFEWRGGAVQIVEGIEFCPNCDEHRATHAERRRT